MTINFVCPSENPAYDALFGAASHVMSLTRNCGFCRTLRSDPPRGVKSVSDTVACVADLLQDKGQEIYHILGGPGWKAVLKVKQILPRLSGVGSNLTETLVLEFDFGCDQDCGGTEAFVLAHEMIKLVKSNPDKNGWMLDNVKSQTTCKEMVFCLSIEFPVEDAKQSLMMAACGQLTPNPEHSNNWMMAMMGHGPLIPP